MAYRAPHRLPACGTGKGGQHRGCGRRPGGQDHGRQGRGARRPGRAEAVDTVGACRAPVRRGAGGACGGDDPDTRRQGIFGGGSCGRETGVPEEAGNDHALLLPAPSGKRLEGREDGAARPVRRPRSRLRPDGLHVRPGPAEAGDNAPAVEGGSVQGGEGQDAPNAREDAGKATGYTGEWVLSQSFRAASTRVCHPSPEDRKRSTTSSDRRMVTRLFTGAF